MIEQEVINFIHGNAILLYAGLTIFSWVVSAMPPPNGSIWYKWLYGVLHMAAGNLAQAGSVLKAASREALLADLNVKPKV
jgi:hypothetical protein